MAKCSLCLPACPVCYNNTLNACYKCDFNGSIDYFRLMNQ
jgi:hypothetical protein